jgi:hypothetical protein
MKRKVTKNIKDFFDSLKYESKKAKEVRAPNKIKILWKAK